jgi:hypothetical protein
MFVPKNNFHYYTVKPLGGTQLPAEFMAAAFPRSPNLRQLSPKENTITHSNGIRARMSPWLSHSGCCMRCRDRYALGARKKLAPVLVSSYWNPVFRRCAPNAPVLHSLARVSFHVKTKERGFLWQNTLFWRMCMHKNSVCCGERALLWYKGKNGVKYAHINRVSTCVLLILPAATQTTSLKSSAIVSNNETLNRNHYK